MKIRQHNISELNRQPLAGCHLIPYSNRNDFEPVNRGIYSHFPGHTWVVRMGRMAAVSMILGRIWREWCPPVSDSCGLVRCQASVGSFASIPNFKEEINVA